MAGKKGRSGRKARTDGKVMKCVSLYIEHKEVDVTPYGKSAQYKWIPDAYFRKFKRYFGTQWQHKLRWAMMRMNDEYETKHLWRCKCQNDVVAWHKKNVDYCPQCGYRPTDFERYKSYAEIQKHTIEPVASKPIKKCSVCKEELTMVEGKYGKTYYCKTCNPKRSKL
tara:strand:- start:316 stop:816 length:501 start_codon:yes stop_codon:yes gene_type:complete